MEEQHGEKNLNNVCAFIMKQVIIEKALQCEIKKEWFYTDRRMHLNVVSYFN